MPKWKKCHTTPHVSVPITNPRRNIPSNHDQQARYQLQLSVLDSFHSEIQGPAFLSVGPDDKFYLLKTFDLEKPFDLHLDPPPLKICHSVELLKMAKTLYNNGCLSYKNGTKIVDPPYPPTNNKTCTSNAAVASNSTPEIPPDPFQPGEIKLHSWMLYMLCPLGWRKLPRWH